LFINILFSILLSEEEMEVERARTPAVPYEQMDEEPESGEGEGGGELFVF
jgi:hypothetical protein